MALNSTISDSKEDRLIEFNCLGAIFLIRETSLTRFPNTLLGNPKSRASFYNDVRQQYIIDRHIVSFEAIMNYYETGKLIVPTIYEPTIFFEELKHFQIDNEIVQHFYNIQIDESSVNNDRMVPFNRILRIIWVSLEYSDYSFTAQIIHVICLLISLLFCFNISIELLPQLSRDKVICLKLPNNHNSIKSCNNRFFDFRPPKMVDHPILWIEQFCTIFLTSEYVLRCLTSPHKWKTITQLINICDLFTLVVNWIYLTLLHMDLSNNDRYDPFFYIRLFQYLMLLRLVRFFCLCRYIQSLRILLIGIQRAYKSILSAGTILLFLTLTFGVIIQTIEKNFDHAHVIRLEDLFNIITISTITVGDAKRVPISPNGKILCSILAGIGLVAISLPLPFIYQIFQSIYQFENIDKRLIIPKYVYPNGKSVDSS